MAQRTIMEARNRLYQAVKRKIYLRPLVLWRVDLLTEVPIRHLGCTTRDTIALKDFQGTIS